MEKLAGRTASQQVRSSVVGIADPSTLVPVHFGRSHPCWCIVDVCYYCRLWFRLNFRMAQISLYFCRNCIALHKGLFPARVTSKCSGCPLVHGVSTDSVCSRCSYAHDARVSAAASRTTSWSVRSGHRTASVLSTSTARDRRHQSRRATCPASPASGDRHPVRRPLVHYGRK